MIRAYRCAALDTPLAYIRKKIDPRPPGAQKRAKKALLRPLTEKSECRTLVAALPSSCPPGQPPLGRIASLGTYRILNRVPLGRIFSTGRALGRDLCDKDFVLVRLQQANMSYMPLSRFTGSAECCSTGSVSILCIFMSQGQYRIYMYLYVPREPLQANMA